MDVLALLRPRIKRLGDVVDAIRPFVSDVVFDEQAVARHLTAQTLPVLRALHEALQELDAFDAATLETTVRSTADQHGLKAGALIHAVRVALTGRTVSPGLFEVMALLGRDTVLARVGAVLAQPSGVA